MIRLFCLLTFLLASNANAFDIYDKTASAEFLEMRKLALEGVGALTFCDGAINGELLIMEDGPYAVFISAMLPKFAVSVDGPTLQMRGIFLSKEKEIGAIQVGVREKSSEETYTATGISWNHESKGTVRKDDCKVTSTNDLSTRTSTWKLRSLTGLDHVGIRFKLPPFGNSPFKVWHSINPEQWKAK